MPGVAAGRPERAAPDREEPLYGEVCPYATVELLKNSEESGGNFATHQHQVNALVENVQGHDFRFYDRDFFCYSFNKKLLLTLFYLFENKVLYF